MEILKKIIITLAKASSRFRKTKFPISIFYTHGELKKRNYLRRQLLCALRLLFDRNRPKTDQGITGGYRRSHAKHAATPAKKHGRNESADAGRDCGNGEGARRQENADQ